MSLPSLVFVPGFKGSRLVSTSSGHCQWLTLWQALGFFTPALGLPLNWTESGQDHDDLVPGGALASVGPVSVYGGFLRWLRRYGSENGQSVYVFGYDWRRDNSESVNSFISFLDSLRRSGEEGPFQVIAHSNGGLVSFVALHRRPDLFHSMLFAGSPFGADIGLLPDLHEGSCDTPNRGLLDTSVLASFCSVFSFFPLNNDTEEQKSHLVKADGTAIKCDFFSPYDWIDLELLGAVLPSGKFHDDSFRRRLHDHLARSLPAAKAFREQLVFQDGFDYPPIAVLANDTTPTITCAVKNGPNAARGSTWDFTTAPHIPGDGRVPFVCAMPPAGVPHVVFRTERPHGELLDDQAIMQEALVQLRSGC